MPIKQIFGCITAAIKSIEVVFLLGKIYYANFMTLFVTGCKSHLLLGAYLCVYINLSTQVNDNILCQWAKL